MASPCGLHLLYEPPNGTKVSAKYVPSCSVKTCTDFIDSIVFVHGLFGHPFKTWTGKRAKAQAAQTSTGESVAQPNSPTAGQAAEDDRKVLWPQDLLPLVIPDVNIYTYGHDASVDHILSSAAHDTIHQKASTLLSDLADMRQTSQEVGQGFRCLSIQDLRYTYMKSTSTHP